MVRIPDHAHSLATRATAKRIRENLATIVRRKTRLRKVRRRSSAWANPGTEPASGWLHPPTRAWVIRRMKVFVLMSFDDSAPRPGSPATKSISTLRIRIVLTVFRGILQ
jgi:hypothetical protein